MRRAAGVMPRDPAADDASGSRRQSRVARPAPAPRHRRTPPSGDRRGVFRIPIRHTGRSERVRLNVRLSASSDVLNDPFPAELRTRSLMPMKRAISALENSVSVITLRARRADQAVSRRRRSALAEREPFRVREERHVVNRHDKGSRHGQWSSVPRCEEHVRTFAAQRARAMRTAPTTSRRRRGRPSERRSSVARD